MSAETNLLAPSGKDEAYENFPVGSFLLPAEHRPAIAAYYAFARATDDIADNPELPSEEKVARLQAFDLAVAGHPDAPANAIAGKLRQVLSERGISDRRARDLLIAFTRDAIKTRYANWNDLIDYCDHSASPVGRFLLDLHGEDAADYPASDALCNALQIINHLQDLKADYLELDRVYLPQDWMDDAGVPVGDLAAMSTSSGLRIVMNRAIAGCDELMISARTLPGRLKSRRLAMESAAIVRIADALLERLRRQDPLAVRVKLGKPAYLRCMLSGVFAVLLKNG
jgi:squalene synthase HpnC